MKHAWLCLVLMLCTSVALAEPPMNDAQRAVSALVQDVLIKPMGKAEKKHRRFSRDPPPPVARRVRVIDAAEVVDARGHRFLRFAIEERRGWDEDDTTEWERAFVGCAYPGSGKVFVQRDDEYVPASNMLGADHDAQPDVCRPANAAELAVAP